jgi:hypothetical protein
MISHIKKDRMEFRKTHYGFMVIVFHSGKRITNLKNHFGRCDKLVTRPKNFLDLQNQKQS